MCSSDLLLSLLDPLPTQALELVFSAHNEGLPLKSLRNMLFSQNVSVTRNFLYTTRESCHGEFLRPLDMALAFPGPKHWELLLLSEREADGVMEQIWPADGSSSCAGTRPILLSFAFLRVACQLFDDGVTGASPRLIVCAPNETRPSGTLGPLGKVFPELVSAQLFNGETTYSAQAAAKWGDVKNTALGQEIQELVRHRKGVVEALVAMRGKQTLLAYSHLEQACD